jgi:hypothetical protein
MRWSPHLTIRLGLQDVEFHCNKTANGAQQFGNQWGEAEVTPWHE